jgi:hypothetical protein
MGRLLFSPYTFAKVKAADHAISYHLGDNSERANLVWKDQY